MYFTLNTSQFRPATFPVLSHHPRLVGTVLTSILKRLESSASGTFRSIALGNWKDLDLEILV